MPVFASSLVACEKDGFSTKPVTRPVESASTRPYSRGSPTWVVTMVAAAPVLSCISTASLNGRSQSASPLATSSGASSAPTAARTLPAVPSGRSSSANKSRIPANSAEEKCDLSCSDRYRRVNTASSTPFAASSSSIYSTTGRPQRRTIGLGTVSVRGRSRVPSPPARMTAFIWNLPTLSFLKSVCSTF